MHGYTVGFWWTAGIFAAGALVCGTLLPQPQNPADLAESRWDVYLKRDRFDQVFGA